MKKLCKILTALMLALSLCLSAWACGKTTGGGGGGDDPGGDDPGGGGTPEIVVPELSELIDDPDAKGGRGTTPEVSRFPEDEEWLRLLEKQTPIRAGETFTETFDGDYYASRLSALTDGGEVDFVTGDDAISGRSLRLTTAGNYAGVRLTGSRFVAGASYCVEMDYRVVVPSDDFIFQFRAPGVEGGASDVFSVFGSAAGAGKLSATFTLGMYSGYYIMIMPRNNPGQIIIDNISVTRLDSRPMASNLSLSGDLAVGSEVSADYTYFDYESDAEGNSEIRWFTSLSGTGLNRVYEGEGKTLTLTSAMRGKYVGFSVTPVSAGGDQPQGLPVSFTAPDTVGGTAPAYGSKFSLAEGESFTETFEADAGEERNLIYVPHGGTDNYIFRETGNFNGNVLRIKSDGSYLGCDFTGMGFAGRGIYRITFDYLYRTMPNQFYVQLRGGGGDKFGMLRKEGDETDKVYRADITLELPAFDDYYLMMFPDASPVELLIDNLTVERLDPAEIVNDPVTVTTAKTKENFESALARKLYPRAAAGVTATITDEAAKAVEGSSLYLASDAGGDVTLTGADCAGGADYTLTLTYRSGSGLLAGMSGGGAFTVLDPAESAKTITVRLTAPAGDPRNVVLRLSPGGEASVDDIELSQVDPEAGQRYETFDTSPVYPYAAVDGATVSLSDVSPVCASGKSLRLVSNGTGGVAFTPKYPFAAGSRYSVSFSYRMTAGENLLLSIGGEEKSVQIKPGDDGRATVSLTAAGEKLTLSAGGAADFLLDDIVIQLDTSAPGEENFDGAGGYTFDVNNEAAVAVSDAAAEQSAFSSGRVLRVEALGPYGGVQLRREDLTFEAGANYRVAFTYKILANPDNGPVYVRVGSDDSNVLPATSAGYGARVEFIAKPADLADCVRLFGGGGAAGLVFTIDDFIVEETTAVGSNLVTFDGTDCEIVPNNGGEVSLETVAGPLISGKAVRVECKAGYDGLIVRPLIFFEAGKTYRIRFDCYVEAAPEGATLYVQLEGQFVQVPTATGTVARVDVTVTCGANDTPSLQLFGSGNAAGQIMYFDNFRVTEV